MRKQGETPLLTSKDSTNNHAKQSFILIELDAPLLLQIVDKSPVPENDRVSRHIRTSPVANRSISSLLESSVRDLAVLIFHSDVLTLGLVEGALLDVWLLLVKHLKKRTLVQFCESILQSRSIESKDSY